MCACLLWALALHLQHNPCVFSPAVIQPEKRRTENKIRNKKEKNSALICSCV
uniref:Uncharacterized protein n=1 Tax=Anguilla anguilla TaxID=7936 RepID=A0A0E9QQC9_ANGAN